MRIRARSSASARARPTASDKEFACWLTASIPWRRKSSSPFWKRHRRGKRRNLRRVNRSASSGSAGACPELAEGPAGSSSRTSILLAWCKLVAETPSAADCAAGSLLVGTWLSLVEHSLGVRGVGSSNLPVPTIYLPWSIVGSWGLRSLTVSILILHPRPEPRKAL